jgi:hypothetical protein
MCYEATIASAGGDKTTLAKSHIISLEDAATNWYSSLLLNFQGFHMKPNTEEGILSYAQ